jgi:hypothetical protein
VDEGLVSANSPVYASGPRATVDAEPTSLEDAITALKDEPSTEESFVADRHGLVDGATSGARNPADPPRTIERAPDAAGFEM